MAEQNNTPPLDEETLRLLQELEGGDKPKAETDAEAPKAKPKAAPKKKAAKKKAAPAKPKAAPKVKPDPDPVTEVAQFPTITNVSKNRRRICRVDLAVGESYTLTADDLEDERLTAKLTRAIELGVLESD